MDAQKLYKAVDPIIYNKKAWRVTYPYTSKNVNYTVLYYSVYFYGLLLNNVIAKKKRGKISKNKIYTKI